MVVNESDGATTVAAGAAVCYITKRSRIRSQNASERLV